VSAPLLLPLQASEAVAIAALLFEAPPSASRLRNRLPVLGLRQTTVLPHTLAPDPVHADSWYLIVSNRIREYWLLHLAPAAAPVSSLFPKPLLLARARLASGLEIVANAVPLASNLNIVIPSLAPRLLARSSAIHDIWSVEAGDDWLDSLTSFGLTNEVVPGVRQSQANWATYLPQLLSPLPRTFCYILSGVPDILSAEAALPFSRFCLGLNGIDSASGVAGRIREIRALASRTVDIELDLSAVGAQASEILRFLNDLRLLGAVVEGVEPAPHIDPREISSPRLAVTIRAARPRGLSLPGPIHWKLTRSAN
jgi:hypothetical protein